MNLILLTITLTAALAILTCVLPTLAGEGDAPTKPARVDDPVMNEIVPDGAQLKLVASEGLKFTEGPVYRPASKDWLFSDIPNNKTHCIAADGKVTVFRDSTQNGNGNFMDPKGRVLTCQHASRSLVRVEADGTVTTLATTAGGKKLNSPNDVIVKSDGTIWFSDPRYGKADDLEQPAEQTFRLDPGAKEPVAVTTGEPVKPNGLCFSPDEKYLYVADGRPEPGAVWRFTVNADNTLSDGKIFCEVTKGTPDGIRTDKTGRLYVTCHAGVEVFTPEGKMLGAILTPKPACNCAFGGPEGKTMLITAQDQVWMIELGVVGRP